MTHHEPTSDVAKHLSPLRGFRVVVGFQPTDESVGYSRNVPRGTKSQTHTDRLKQSLLAKAFRGELVPTEHAIAAREAAITKQPPRSWNDCDIHARPMRQRNGARNPRAERGRESVCDLSPTERLSWLTALGITLRARDGRRVSGLPPSESR